MNPPDAQHRKACIALIGMRGSGKTVVGRALADLIGGDHVDTDQRIVACAGRTIAEIFETEGELGFRRREARVIAEVAEARPAVISVGGGAVLAEANVASLKAVANLVYLTAPPEVLWQRTAADPASAASRPALTGRTGPDEVRKLLAQRSPHYDRAADLTVATEQQEPDQVAREIVDRLNRTGRQ